MVTPASGAPRSFLMWRAHLTQNNSLWHLLLSVQAVQDVLQYTSSIDCKSLIIEHAIYHHLIRLSDRRTVVSNRYKTVYEHNFTFATVKGAGHMVPQ